MTNFVYISPAFPATNVNFCEHLAASGVRVLGVGDLPYEQLPERLRSALAEYYRVDSLEDYGQAFRAVAFLSFRHGKIDWIESNNEYWLGLDARLRDDFNVRTGHGTAIIESIKSKSAMKPVYAAAGVPTARQARVTDADGVLAFAAQVGYPLVAKPEYGIGAHGAFLLTSDADVAGAFATGLEVPYVVEEFVVGELVSYDAILDGEGGPVFEAATLWPPSIMDIVTDRLDLCYRIADELPPGLAEVGLRTAHAFGMRNRFVHEEFFRLTSDRPGLGRRGDYVGLEVNMRPAGGNTVDMYNYARDADVYQIYTDVVTERDTGAAAKARLDPQIAIYAGRRDEFTYRVPWADVLARYSAEIAQAGRNPALFVPQMGNDYAIIRTADAARADQFAADVTDRV